MLLLIILAVIAVLSFYIAYKSYCDGIVGMIALLVGLCATAAFAIFFVLALSAHSNFERECKLTEYEERYKAIAYSCQSNPENVVTLSEEIAEYNSDVLKGRIEMDNFWLSFFDYDFYYDLPLIETE